MTRTKGEQNKFDDVKKILLTRKHNLEEEFEHLNADKDEDQVQDPADQASSSALETLKSSLQSNEYEEYRMILNALEMIQEGSYGECTDCNESISSRRLASYPNAARCLICQETAEEATAGSQMNSFL
ncbi:MAG: RNA polymerase-binding transcription factor DksA [Alteromonas naphthalenivorans]